MRGLFFGGTLIGIISGFGVGLFIAWILWPINYTEVSPAELRLDLKNDYLRMIAAAYSLDGDMARAWQQIGTLQFDQPAVALATLIRHESHPSYQQAETRLALDVNQMAIALARPTFTPHPTKTRPSVQHTPTNLARNTPTVSPTRPATPIPTITSEPTALPPTSIPNPNAPRFQLKSKTALNCQETRARAYIAVDVQDTKNNPQSGIGVEVTWNAGDEIFYTGFKPERGMGYADLTVKPGTYNVRLTDNARSEVVTNLKIDADTMTCTRDLTQVYGWKLVFQKQ